jgi:hypothetical protein
MFNFAGYGNKALKKNTVRVGTRKHFRCSDRKVTGCQAAYTITLDSNGRELRTEFQHEHNHLPPHKSALRLLQSVRDTIKCQFKARASTTVIQQQRLLNASDPSSGAQVPSKEQVNNMKKYEKIKARQSRMFMFIFILYIIIIIN